MHPIYLKARVASEADLSAALGRAGGLLSVYGAGERRRPSPGRRSCVMPVTDHRRDSAGPHQTALSPPVLKAVPQIDAPRVLINSSVGWDDPNSRVGWKNNEALNVVKVGKTCRQNP